MGGRSFHPQGDRHRMSKSGRSRRPATHVVTAGRRKEWTAGIVNPPVWRASTILYDDVAALDAARHAPDDQLYYGRRGTPTQWSLAEALTEMEPGAAGTKLYPRSEEHTSELQSLMRISYAVFCLKKKIIPNKEIERSNDIM